MTNRVMLQKLLTVDLSEAIFQHGIDWVGGIVIEAGGTARFGARDLLQAYGFDADPPYVDVVRFPLPVCAPLKSTQNLIDPQERPWPTYPNGFLRPVGDAIIPAYELELTRWPVRSEWWRIKPDGSQDIISHYRGVALGWQGAREWRPASTMYGLRARWQGADYAADIIDEQVELVTFQDPGTPEWTSPRPMTWSRRVPRPECQLHEMMVTATWRDVPVRVADVRNWVARVRMIGSDPSQARIIDASMVDQGVFENTNVPAKELVSMQAVSNELTQTEG